MPWVWLAPVAVAPTEVASVETLSVVLSVRVGVSRPVVAVSAVAAVVAVSVAAVWVTSTPPGRVLVSSTPGSVDNGVGVAPPPAPQAAVNKTSTSAPNKNRRETFFIFLSPESFPFARDGNKTVDQTLRSLICIRAPAISFYFLWI